MITKNIRYEHKYLISMTQWHRLKALLSQRFDYDDHTDRFGQYRVDSIYFDTYNGYYYDAKEAAIANRYLIRVRQYSPNSPTLRLELKGKVGDGVYKWSVWVTKEEYSEILKRDYHCLLSKGEVGEYLYTEMTLYQPQPIYLIRYLRDVFVLKDYEVRISGDSYIKGQKTTDLDDQNAVSIYDDSSVILEVKGKRDLPPYLSQLLATYQPLKVTNSKFERAVEML